MSLASEKDGKSNGLILHLTSSSLVEKTCQIILESESKTPQVKTEN